MAVYDNIFLYTEESATQEQWMSQAAKLEFSECVQFFSS
jgi:hypothetical protein